MRTKSFGTAVAAILLTLIVVGCSEEEGRNLPMAPVSGKVAYPESIPGGDVIFQHDTGEMTVLKFAEDGTYSGEVPLGHNRVIVVSQTSSFESSPADKGRTMEMFTSHVPRKYSDFGTSGFEVDIADGENTFDIALQQ